MKDFNCSIYIPGESAEYANFYLSMRGIKYSSKMCADSTIEIRAKEKYSKMLDKLAQRCYN